MWRLSLIVKGIRGGHRVGRGEKEVDLAVLDLGVQGLLIEQLRDLGLDEHPRTAVVDEGITGHWLGYQHELEPLVSWRDTQPGALGGLGILRKGADDGQGVLGQGKQKVAPVW